MSVSTSESRRAMAPPARRERADTSDGRKPRSVPRNFTVCRRCLVMSDGVTERVPDGVKTRARGVDGGAPRARRWTTRRIIARVGQQKWWPLRPSLMTSPLTPFF